MTNTGDILQIDTPENVTFDYDVAGIGSRFLAAALDSLLITLWLAFVIVVGVVLSTQLAAQDDSTMNWFIAIMSTLSFLIFWGYYILFEIFWNGQTPGKRWIKLRVIRVDGTPVTAAEVVIRNLVRLIDLLPAAYAVGVVCMFTNDKSRRLGDLAAGTLVVHEREAVKLVRPGPSRESALATVIAQGEAPADFPVDRLRWPDIEIIEEYLLRRGYLPNREQLAGHILSSMYLRLGLPADNAPASGADDALAAIYKKFQRDRSRELPVGRSE
jgi:uncharacterized RDD family membrane protein YckC